MGDLLVAVVMGGGGLGGAGKQGVVAAAIVIGLHIQVAVHAVADLQLRTCAPSMRMNIGRLETSRLSVEMTTCHNNGH